MTAAMLLASLRSAGATIIVKAGRLEIDAPAEVLSDDVIEQLRQFKPAILDLLSSPCSPAKPSWRCRCGSTTWRDVVLRHEPHFGRSTRRDCAKCSRFVSFPFWYGKPSEN